MAHCRSGVARRPQNSSEFPEPEEITHDSSGQLSRPCPFSLLGSSRVVRGLLLVSDRVRPQSVY